MSVYDAHATDLANLAARGRQRTLVSQSGRDFSSNDYLGLATSSLLADAARAAIERGVSIGSGGSRLLRGNHPEHVALEAEAAAFFGRESALFFSSGYAANAAFLSTLPQRGDLIVYDALVHASAHEGMRLSRAVTRSAAHNDPEAFDAAIRAWRRDGNLGRVWIAVESVYSMDGDRAPLEALAHLAQEHDAILLVDEAHATGVFGFNGCGLAANLAGTERVITLHTCGKALGSEGALLCGPAIIRDFLINRGRALIYSTAPSPLIAAVVRAGLRALRQHPGYRHELMALVDHAHHALGPYGVTRSGSQILPLILGDDARTMRVAVAMQEAGFDVRGIRPPTVPNGTARLRISITRNITVDDIDDLAEALGKALS